MAYHFRQAIMTSGEIAIKSGAALRTVNKWASENDVKYTGEGRRKTYIWSSDDFQRFTNRAPKGRPKKNNPE